MAAIPDILTLGQTIVAWSDREDLLPELMLQFMAFTGQEASDVLRIDENTVSLPIPIVGNNVAVPPDLLELKGLTVYDPATSSPDIALEYIPWDAFTNEEEYKNLSAPKFYTRRNGFYHFVPALEDGTIVRMDYFNNVPELSQTNVTNWMLQKYPLVYLYGCLKHLYNFAMADDRANYWEERFARELTRIQALYERSKYEGSVLTVRRSNDVNFQ